MSAGWPAADLAGRTHYLEFAGEVPEFLTAARHAEAAEQAGIMVLPGVGFGVVVTDLLAVHVAGRITT